ncbi:cell wall hydrolase [Blautia sp. MSJ-19]|uniref:cell wall hydrolase n=1 Tax=Blautia sp. MSJ-19 TaxID=2841517 RepID=UPI001C0EE570|nr:cell wall hydrolase [Blautia sp. MSJ-19]MBU5480066.1 cell wall hydrolase [Blautia sp. MSJ-19]
MRKIRLTGIHNDSEKGGREQNSSLHGFVSLSVCALTVLAVSGGCKLIGSERQNQVYAAAEDQSSMMYEDGGYTLPSGIAGVVSGVNATPSAGMTVNRIGISCDDVIVGQRVQKVTSSAVEMNVSESMATTIDTFDEKVVSMSSSAKLMSDEDYENLLQIVEAEAGTEDLKGRILVANVIMNRVKYAEFPDNATDVIWQYIDGVAQFSPVADGRISEVVPTDETKEAVKQALEGVDYSEGALFFIQRSAAAKGNVQWFDKNLTRLFKHGVHEFYTYPEEAKN